MSYDLLFNSPEGELTLDAFGDYFRDRPNYRYENSQAWYENEDTGVYFSFEFGDDDDEEDGDEDFYEDESPFAASFNINYYRPHYFGLEAAGELDAFVRHFRLVIDDPQHDGMATGPFTREGFLRGWNHGNQFGYACIQDSSKGDPPGAFSLPTAELERIWSWNYARKAFQDRVEDTNFVPRIMFLEFRGRVCTAAVWPDGIPICLPKCDLLFVIREELRTDPTVEKEVGLLEWSSLAPLLDRFPYQSDDGGYYELTYSDPLPIVVDFLQSQMLLEPQPDSGIAPDSVLKAELIAAVRSKPRINLDLN